MNTETAFKPSLIILGWIFTIIIIVNSTPVTMAVKSHLRNGLPVVIAISTNDALANAAKNIGLLQSMRNYYFVPYRQDNYSAKPNSVVADFDRIEDTITAALQGRQLQPVLL